jgi:hypothetical protein
MGSGLSAARTLATLVANDNRHGSEGRFELANPLDVHPKLVRRAQPLATELPRG